MWCDLISVTQHHNTLVMNTFLLKHSKLKSPLESPQTLPWHLFSPNGCFGKPGDSFSNCSGGKQEFLMTFEGGKEPNFGRDIEMLVLLVLSCLQPLLACQDWHYPTSNCVERSFPMQFVLLEFVQKAKHSWRISAYCYIGKVCGCLVLCGKVKRGLWSKRSCVHLL